MSPDTTNQAAKTSDQCANQIFRKHKHKLCVQFAQFKSKTNDFQWSLLMQT